MPLRVLEHGSSYAIIGGDGNGLRVVDRPRKCWGYRNACACKACTAREGRKVKRPKISVCECASPLTLAGSRECFRCGKTTERRAA
jgi:hypothetical protein